MKAVERLPAPIVHSGLCMYSDRIATTVRDVNALFKSRPHKWKYSLQLSDNYELSLQMRVEEPINQSTDHNYQAEQEQEPVPVPLHELNP
jgi:hypothetical protein